MQAKERLSSCCLQKARELHPDLSGDLQDAAFVSLLQAYEVKVICMLHVL